MDSPKAGRIETHKKNEKNNTTPRARQVNKNIQEQKYKKSQKKKKHKKT